MKPIELPDALVRDAAAAAARRGVSLKEFLVEAVRAKLDPTVQHRRGEWPVPPPKVSRSESRKADQRIAEEFGRVEWESWR